jgi:tetratricopeptide (TPR) repeat protein
MDLMDKSDLESYLESHDGSKLGPILAEIYLQEDRIDDMINLCQQEITKDPKSPYGYYLLALAEIKSNEIANAIEHLKQTVSLDSGFLEAYYKLVEIGRDTLSPGALKTCYVRIAELNPLDENARMVAGQIGESADKEALTKIDLPKVTRRSISQQPAPEVKAEETKVEQEPVVLSEQQPKEEIAVPEKPTVAPSQPQLSEEEAHLGPVIENEVEPAEPKTEPQLEKPAPEPDIRFAVPLRDSIDPKKKMDLIHKEIGLTPDFDAAPEGKKKTSTKIEDTPVTEARGTVSEKTAPSTDKKPPAKKSKTAKKTTVTRKKSSRKIDENTISFNSRESINDKVELKIPIPTFTLVEVFKKQKLYNEALQLLDVLEKRSKNKDKIEKERRELLRLKVEGSKS